MKLYNKYLFYKTITAFASIALLLVILVWFSRTVPFVKYITENGIELQQFFFLFLLILPWLLLFIIPISLFVAVLAIYNRFIINNEITILKNTGLTKIKIVQSTLVIATFLSLFCFFLSFYLMPYANKKLRLARNNFNSNYSSLSFSKSTFEVLKNLTIYVKDKNEKTNELFGILLHDEKDLEHSITITSESGKLAFEEGKLLLYMNKGTIQRHKYQDNKSEILNFDSYIFNLSENKEDESFEKRWKAKERFLHELLYPDEKSSEAEKSRYYAELQQRFTYPLMPIIFSLIALSFILRGSFSRHGNITNIIFATIAAVLFLGLTITTYRLLESAPNSIFFLYLNFIFFFISTIYLLTKNEI